MTETGLIQSQELLKLDDSFSVKADQCNLWPFPIGAGCCAMEYYAVQGSKYNQQRIGLETNITSPSKADVLIITGTITEKILPMIKQVYEQMPFPKWVISLGACASSGGMYQAYNVVQGIEKEIPVDVFVPGCPPTPEAIFQGYLLLRERIERGVCSAVGRMKQ